MAANAGRALLISLDTGVGSVEVVGQTTATINVNRTPIDITTKSSDAVRELLVGLGTFGVDIDFEGIEKDAVMMGEAFDPAPTTHYAGSVVIGNLGTLTGDFFLGNYSIAGEDGDNSIGYTANIMSSGTVTFTAT